MPYDCIECFKVVLGCNAPYILNHGEGPNFVVELSMVIKSSSRVRDKIKIHCKIASLFQLDEQNVYSALFNSSRHYSLGVHSNHCVVIVNILLLFYETN